MDSAKKANRPSKHSIWHVQGAAGRAVSPGGIPIARRMFETHGTGTNVLLSQPIWTGSHKLKKTGSESSYEENH